MKRYGHELLRCCSPNAQQPKGQPVISVRTNTSRGVLVIVVLKYIGACIMSALFVQLSAFGDQQHTSNTTIDVGCENDTDEE